MKSKRTNTNLKVGIENLGLPTNVAKESSEETVAGNTGKPESSNSEKGTEGNAKDEDSAKGGTSVMVATVPGIPAYPTLTVSNLAEFQTISYIVGKPAIRATSCAIKANKPIDTITIDDIDLVQAELESLLSNVAVRFRTLKSLQSGSGGPQHQQSIASVAPSIDPRIITPVLSPTVKLVHKGKKEGGTPSQFSLPRRKKSPPPSPNTTKEDAKMDRLQTQFWEHVDTCVKDLNKDDVQGVKDILKGQSKLPSGDDAKDLPILLNPDDEILEEIRRTQGVLKRVHKCNGEELRGLIDVGKRAINRCARKSDLDEANKEVVVTFKNRAIQRRNKTPFTKSEQEWATKCLETRTKTLLRVKPIGGHSSDDDLLSD